MKNNVENALPENVLKHSKSVAEVMHYIAEENKDEMYVLGLFHDIGKLHGFANHSQTGYELLSKMNFAYANEVLHHGSVKKLYASKELDLLNAADLSVDSKGNIVGYKRRIEDIGERYGFESSEYLNAVELSQTLLPLLKEISSVFVEEI